MHGLLSYGLYGLQESKSALFHRRFPEKGKQYG